MKAKPFSIFLILAFFATFCCTAHPMPNSLVLLNLQDDKLIMELQLPIQEFELAFGQNLSTLSDVQILQQEAVIRNYILKHVMIRNDDHSNWAISIDHVKMDSTGNKLNGVYKELIVQLSCSPRDPRQLRNFTLQYDVIIHQVLTHVAILRISQDFNNGIASDKPMELGIIQLDIASNRVKPMMINIDAGNRWAGFGKMIALGMHHIRTGLDHLLFLLVLLLVSPLLHRDHQWTNFGGTAFTFKRVLKFVTAFTIGHSATLILISIFPLNHVSRIIEIGIVLTILLSAIHAFRPLFPNKEMLVTFCFGLIHGAAFAASIHDLQLSYSLTFISILGFNIGIELMQLMVLVCFLPVIFLSKMPFYKFIRIGGAVICMFAAIAWLAERISGHSNFITDALN